MTNQELLEGLQAVERRESLDEAREMVRGLLGRMDRAELAVMARAVAREIAPAEFAAMSPEDRELWRGWRISAALRDRQDKAAAKTEGGVQ